MTDIKSIVFIYSTDCQMSFLSAKLEYIKRSAIPQKKWEWRYSKTVKCHLR